MDFDLYPWFAFLSSLVFTVLFGGGVVQAGKHYVYFHDDRAAVERLVALALFIISLGLLVSSVASFLGGAGFDVAARAEVRNLGLGMARGTLLVLSIVVLIAAPRYMRASSRKRD